LNFIAVSLRRLAISLEVLERRGKGVQHDRLQVIEGPGNVEFSVRIPDLTDFGEEEKRRIGSMEFFNPTLNTLH
jgi:hypothetical protein